MMLVLIWSWVGISGGFLVYLLEFVACNNCMPFRDSLLARAWGRYGQLVAGICLGLAGFSFALWLHAPGVVDARSLSTGQESASDFNLVLAIVSVVLTVVTGIGVTAAWRALDNANTAERHATAILDKLEIRELRTAAIIDAVDRKNALLEEIRQSATRPAQNHEKDIEAIYVSEAMNVFLKKDVNDLCLLIRNFRNSVNFRRFLRRAGRDYLEYCLRAADLDPNHRQVLIDVLRSAD